MATTSNTSSVTDLISRTNIAFIREQNLVIVTQGARPNSKLYAFFDGVNVDSFCSPVLSSEITSTVLEDPASFVMPEDRIGEPIYSDASGTAIYFFKINAGTWPTGAKEVLITDVEDLSDLEIIGNVYGRATAIFNTSGILETFQVTNTTTNITTVQLPPVEVVRMPWVDPLAQSFFTFGQTGGCFVTSIDIYFQSKDETIPVRLELREMENGYPSQNFVTNKEDCTVHLEASDVNISNDTLSGTKFKFSVPIYLEEDKEYCYVLRTNSNNYNIWCSRLGEKDIVSGNTIFEQPYVGSLFKSSNNSTWTAEQFEDIKFTLNKAEFDISSPGLITCSGSATERLLLTSDLYTTTGSKVLTYKGRHKHGLKVGSKASVYGSDKPGVVYNGIPGSALRGKFPVISVLDDYSFSFEVLGATSATITGPIRFSNVVTEIKIINSGSDYTVAPVISISAPSGVGGVNATATTIIKSGKITGVTITNNGSGYQEIPEITVSGLGGAILQAVTSAAFIVKVNIVAHTVSPQLYHRTINGTKISSEIQTSTFDYTLNPMKVTDLSRLAILDQNSIVASRDNETDFMGDVPSFNYKMTLSSNNKNTSPVLDFRKSPEFIIGTFSINYQNQENVESVIGSSPVTAVTVTSGGTGYAAAPDVTVIPDPTDKATNIVAASITSNISVGSVISFNIVTPGSGYTKPPQIIVDAPVSGTSATGYSSISPVNSELNTIGNADSRYFTKRFQLSEQSTAVKIIAYAASTSETDFDWYIRVSLTNDSTKHDENIWRRLIPATSTNKSKNFFDYKSYEFNLNELPSFDTYDLKCVLRSKNPSRTPIIRNYSVIIAT